MYNLIKARNKKNLTQANMAELLSIAVPTYTLYENGRRKPNFETLIKISKILDVSIDYLVENNRDQDITDDLAQVEIKLNEILEIINKIKQ